MPIGQASLSQLLNRSAPPLACPVNSAAEGWSRSPGLIQGRGARHTTHRYSVVSGAGTAFSPWLDWRRIALSISRHSSGFSRSTCLAFSRPCASLRAIVLEIRAPLLDQPQRHRHVQHVPCLADPLRIRDVELRLPKRRRHLVLGHPHPRPVPDHLAALLERRRSAGCPAAPTRRTSAPRPPTSSPGSRTSPRSSRRNWFVNTIAVFDRLDRPAQLAQRLAHQPRLQARDGCPPSRPRSPPAAPAPPPSRSRSRPSRPSRTSASAISSACSPVSGCEI